MRKSAEERREEILAVAMEHFARGGYHGTSTETIARDVGISQPYLFRLFRTKRELFLACNDRACGKVIETFRRAAERAGEGEVLEVMGQAYSQELLPDRYSVLMMMQGVAAVSDPEIQVRVRERYGDVVSEIASLSGASPDEIWTFLSTGMLLNILAALEVQDSDHPVFRAWTASHA